MLNYYYYNYIKISCFFILLTTAPLKAQDNYLKFEHLTVNSGLPQNSIYGIIKDKYGFMWFGTWEGICRYDGYKYTVFRADESNANALSNNRVNSLYKDSNGDIWVATSNYNVICKYNFETEDFTRFDANKVKEYIWDSLKRARLYYHNQAGNNNFQWSVLNRNSGLKLTNRHTGAEWIYKSDVSSLWSLNDNDITYIYLDDNEILWVGTHNGGINKTDTRSKPFVTYSDVFNSSNPIVENIVRTICMDKADNLWIGTEKKGILKIDRKKNTIYYYVNNPKTSNSLINNEVRKIYCDRLGYLWIGTKGGLDRFDPRTNHFNHYTVNSERPIPNDWVFWIMEDHSGYLWIGTFNGIAKYNRKEDRFLAFDPQSTLKSKSVRVILEDRDYQLWVATEGGGITRFNRDSSSGFKEKLVPTHFTSARQNSNSLISDQVLTMMQDEQGYLWIGTNNGLCRFDRHEKFVRFSVKNGLPDDLIMGILSDEHGHIWISHKKGLSRMDLKNFSLRTFDSQDGLQGNDFSQNAFFKNKSTGEMFFGGINGLNSFFPDSIKDNPFLPKVVFTGLQVSNNQVGIRERVNNRIILRQSMLLTKEISLTYWDKNFSVEFAALHFSNPKGNRYKYKLEGFDSDWIDCDAYSRKASYSGLPASTYFLKVMASNSDGVWNPEPAVLKIIILPPWWLSWWAYLVYFISGALIVWFIYKYIATRIAVRKNEEVHQAKLKFFTEISHEFRTPLSLIIDPLEKIMNENLSKEIIKQYCLLMHRNAKHLLLLINQLLDFRKLEAGHLTLNLHSSDIILFIRSVTSSFEALAIKKNITYLVHSSTDQLIMSFDDSKLNMVLNNLLSNAFKFTPEKGRIEVNIGLASAQSPGIIIKVTDTGIGIPWDEQEKVFRIFYQSTRTSSLQEGSGIGLALTRELVQLHGGIITLESEVGKGSCFSVFLPAKEEAAKDRPSQETVSLLDEVPVIDSTSSDLASPDLPLLLIVDDNADIRIYIELNFNKNYRIEMAANGAEGFQRATQSIPDVIISDVMMPGMSGLELCRLLKSDERTSHVPVILLTAKQSDETKKEGYETGADAYVTKPFNTTVLQAQIRNILTQRQRLREWFSHGSGMELKKISINVTDESFLKKVVSLIEENMANEDFDIDSLAEKLKMSRSQFYRKIKALTNKTLHDFVSTIRMNKALEYLLSGEYSISEIAYKVGYSLPNNFTRTFVKHYGTTPRQYLDMLRHPSK